MLGEVVERTPHGPTGDLAAGWQVTHGRAPAAYLLTNTATRPGKNGPVPYAQFVEYGTATRGYAQPMVGPVMTEWRARVGRRR